MNMWIGYWKGIRIVDGRVQCNDALDTKITIIYW